MSFAYRDLCERTQNAREVLENGVGSKRPFNDDPGAKGLLPVLSGEWCVGRLFARSALKQRGEKALMGGVVIWHKDTVGPSASDAAAKIRDMCNAGCSRYNDLDETDEFLAMGGRLINRMAWEDSGLHPLNDSLPPDSKFKFEDDDPHDVEVPLGPLFLFTPAHTYLDNEWPILRDMPHYGRNSEVKPTLTRVGNGGIHAFFAQQMYMAGRILTKPIAYGDKTSSAAYMVLTHTYSAPESFDDTDIEGTPVGRLPAQVVERPEYFVDFVLGASDQELSDVLGSLSSQRLFSAIEEGINNNVKCPGTDRAAAIGKVIPFLIRPIKGGKPPSMVRLFYAMVDSMSFKVFGAFVMSLYKMDMLSSLVATVRAASPDDNWRKLAPGTLYGLCPTLECVEAFLKTNIVPTNEAIVATMDRPQVFEPLYERLITVDLLSEAKRETKRLEMAVNAVRGMHSAILMHVLQDMSKKERDELASAQNIPIVEPPAKIAGHIPSKPLYGEGNICQVVLGSYMSNAVANFIRNQNRGVHEQDAFRRTICVLIEVLQVDPASCRIPENHALWAETKRKFLYTNRGRDLTTKMPKMVEEVLAQIPQHVLKANAAVANDNHNCEKTTASTSLLCKNTPYQKLGRLELETSMKSDIAPEAKSPHLNDDRVQRSRRSDRYWFNRARERMNIY